MAGESSPATGAPALTADERTWGMIAHLSALSGFVVPMGNIIGPIVVLVMKKDSSEFVADQAKEALNFQIAALIAGFISFGACFFFIGFPMLFAVVIYCLVMEVIAGLKANEGIRYRYPVTLRLVK